jgi:hypothetical protein
MALRLLLFVLARRVHARRLVAIAGTLGVLALGGARLTAGVAQQRFTLTVTGYDVNPGIGTRLAVYSGDRPIAEASVFDGSVVAPGVARFVLRPGDYLVYATADLRNVRITPSGTLRSVTVPVHLDRDREINIRRAVPAR